MNILINQDFCSSTLSCFYVPLCLSSFWFLSKENKTYTRLLFSNKFFFYNYYAKCHFLILMNVEYCCCIAPFTTLASIAFNFAKFCAVIGTVCPCWLLTQKSSKGIVSPEMVLSIRMKDWDRTPLNHSLGSGLRLTGSVSSSKHQGKPDPTW